MYKQVLDSVSNSLALTSIFAALPLVTLFVLLGVLRLRAWIAGLAALVVALVIAITVYSMPASQALLAGTEGASFAVFPILWIVINALWIYNMTVITGHFDVLRRSFAKVSDDHRIQGVIIAFCFGALLEALAGFGTPVAITSVMLIALGYRPIKAASVALVANTAPVAFGALAVPITTLGTITGISQDTLGAMVGRQTPLLGVFVPVALVYIIDGRRGVRQTLPAMAVCGLSFAITQYAVSNFVSIPLTDILASLVSAGATVLFVRVWHPVEIYTEQRESVAAGGAGRDPGSGGAALFSGIGDETPELPDTPREITRAYAPYVIIIAVFALAQIPAIKDLLAKPTKVFQWPGLHIVGASGKPSTLPTFTLNWLAAAGTLLIVAGLLTIPVLGIRANAALRAYLATYRQLAAAIVTVMAVLALAYVMNGSGQTATLGAWMAGVGGAFALFSPLLGWLGVAVTGSDTSSNSLFGALQVAAAHKAGLSPTLLAAANSSGGVLGKMISPQNLAIAAAATGLSGREGEILRKVVGWSLLFAVLMCVLVYLQSTSVLSWMVP